MAAKPSQSRRPGASGRHQEPGPAQKTKPAIPYDFRRPGGIPVDQMRSIKSLYEALARGLSCSLSAYLRTFVAVDVASVAQTSFEEFSQGPGEPATGIPISLPPHEGYGLLQISHTAAFPILEILLGGPGKSAQGMQRDITDIEKSILEAVLRLLVQDLRAAWMPLDPIEFTMQLKDFGASAATLAAPKEPFLAVKIQIQFAEATGVIAFGMPSRIVSHVLQGATAKTPVPRGASPSVLRALQGAHVELDACLNGPQIRFQDLLNLEAGDLLALNYRFGKEFELEVNGTAKFTGQVVASGERRAFEVKHELESEVTCAE